MATLIDRYLYSTVSPTCSPNQKTVYGARRNQTILIDCHLTAQPAVQQFYWRFNNSNDVIDVDERHSQSGKHLSSDGKLISSDGKLISSDGNALRSPLHEHVSTLKYFVRTDLDYGTLSCWGKNRIGTQSHHCLFNIVPAEIPKSPENCSFSNSSNVSLTISCNPGYDGGLKQKFIAEIYDSDSMSLVLNLTESRKPTFELLDLEPDKSFIATVYAVNSEGVSEKKILRGNTDEDFAEKHIAQVSRM